MDLKQILDTLNYICNKEQSGTTLTDLQYNQLLPICSVELFEQEYKKFEETQTITEALMPFKVWLGQNGTLPLQVDSHGYATIPSDYAHYSSLLFRQVLNNADCTQSIKYRKIDVLTDQQWDARLGDSVKMPTMKFPVCNFQNAFIRFAPANLQFVDFVYLKNPSTPYYATTQDTLTDESVYDAANSVQLEWDGAGQLQIMSLILEKIGINLKEQGITQYAELKRAEESS